MDECDMDIRFCRQLQCHNTVGSYTCGCRQGFKRVVADNNREYACADIDECLNRYICPRNAVCENREGGYKCICDAGFQGETCSDINECINNKTCDEKANCYNYPGSFECACQTGFFGTGQKCERGQCQDSVCADNKICKSLTSIDCVCKDGFSDGVNDTCDDIDECSLLKNCDTHAKCINSPGSYLCECGLGFYGDGKTCLEGDCVESECPANEQCVSPRRSDCKCKDGFHRDKSEKCIDTNECETENKCHQDAMCSNTFGSYYCDCKTGFFGTGFSCLKGECIDGSCPGNQTCIASTSSCHCSKGLQKKGKYCFDIDECSLGTHDCLKTSNCINVPKSYLCECPSGFYGDGTKCLKGDCIESECKANEQCVSPRRSDCECKDGYYRDESQKCTDMNECQNKNACHKHALCSNAEGSYTCHCNLGFGGNGFSCKE